MAKRRLINTKFWSDTYISDLDPSEKLLFIYFLTNPYTNICGAYEISLRQVALDTGFDKDIIEKIVARFSNDDKIHYIHGYIVIKNFIKHQEVNPKVKIGIENEIKELPKDIQDIVYHSLSYLNSNPNLIKSKETTETKVSKATAYLSNVPQEDLKDFTSKFEVTERQVKNKGEDLLNYCKSKGKFYTDYKAFMSNALKKDFGLRPPKLEISPHLQGIPLNPQQALEKKMALEKIRDGMHIKP